MPDHPNAALLRKGYEAFARGDIAALTDMFAEDMVWHLSGDNLISGEHKGRDAVFAVFAKTMELTGGTFKIDLHDIVANVYHWGAGDFSFESVIIPAGVAAGLGLLVFLHLFQPKEQEQAGTGGVSSA